MMHIIRNLNLVVLFTFFSCNNSHYKIDKPLNVVWLVAEDLSPYIPSFGDSTVSTPNLNRLASEGVIYKNVFSVSGVCSPSRAAIVTGMYPSSIGAHHMRTLYQQPQAKSKGIINYEVVPPPEIKMVSQILRENNYYCTNNFKEDVQFHPSKLAWDESSVYAHWRNRPKDKPFFSVFNFGVTHESNLWNPFHRTYDLEKFPPLRSNKEWWKQFEGLEKPLYVDTELDVNIPPYLPNTKIVKNDIRRMYSNIIEMDKHVGLIMNQLEKDDLLDNTIIVWYTDHGGPLPREKRLLYDSGLHVPMIIRYPNQDNRGEKNNQLISFIDFAPTLLSLLNIPIPDFMQGRAFAGYYEDKKQRKYIHASADRFDEYYDMIRAVRDKNFKYLKNYHPDKGYYLPLKYREKMDSMQELLLLNSQGQLNADQKQWFRESKPEEELFNISEDPFELNNLAQNKNYKKILIEMRRECEQWMINIDDKGFIPEEELIKQFWPEKIQPITADPIIIKEEDFFSISCDTKGAVIGYKYKKQDKMAWIGWRPYKSPIELNEADEIDIIAHRIGFLPSNIINYKK